MSNTYVIAPDPPVRPDGRCANCLGPRKHAGLKPIYASSAKADPFCSSDCARDWHHAPRTPTRYAGQGRW